MDGVDANGKVRGEPANVKTPAKQSPDRSGLIQIRFIAKRGVIILLLPGAARTTLSLYLRCACRFFSHT